MPRRFHLLAGLGLDRGESGSSIDAVVFAARGVLLTSTAHLAAAERKHDDPLRAGTLEWLPAGATALSASAGRPASAVQQPRWPSRSAGQHCLPGTVTGPSRDTVTSGAPSRGICWCRATVAALHAGLVTAGFFVL